MRAIGHDHKGHARGTIAGSVVLPHDERTLRRRLITLRNGEEVLVDLPHTVAFETGDVLVLEDGKLIEITAAEEDLYEVRGRDLHHLAELVWHIGNRHLPCELAFSQSRVLIGRDHVIRDMLEGLGAAVREVVEPFSPIRGAYSGTAHGHSHAGEGGQHHGHE